MADLDPLIRVRKHAIDQKQKFLAELYRQAEELERQKQGLLDQMQKEKDAIADMGAEMMGFFGSYAQSVKQRVEDIDDSRQRLETRITAAQEDIRDAFADMKKIEMVKEQREEEEQRERDKKESNILDEIGIDSFLRNSEE